MTICLIIATREKDNSNQWHLTIVTKDSTNNNSNNNIKCYQIIKENYIIITMTRVSLVVGRRIDLKTITITIILIISMTKRLKSKWLMIIAIIMVDNIIISNNKIKVNNNIWRRWCYNTYTKIDYPPHYNNNPLLLIKPSTTNFNKKSSNYNNTRQN